MNPVYLHEGAYAPGLFFSVWAQPGKRLPVIVFLHGGGWDSYTREDVPYPEVAAYLATQGFVVVNADYPLTGGDPQTQHDAILALMAVMRQHGRAFGGDPSRVGVLGISAGAQLGLMAGLNGVAGGTRPDAVACWSPPGDLVKAYAQGNGPETLGVGGYLNVPLQGHEALYEDWSPTLQMHWDCPPLLIVHGSDEPTNAGEGGLAVEQANDLEAAAQSVGVSVTKYIVPGTTHGFFHGGWPDFNVADRLQATSQWFWDTLGS